MHVVILNVVVINFQRSDGVFERPSASSFELENTTYRQWKNIHKCIICNVWKKHTELLSARTPVRGSLSVAFDFDP